MSIRAIEFKDTWFSFLEARKQEKEFDLNKDYGNDSTWTKLTIGPNKS